MCCRVSGLSMRVFYATLIGCWSHSSWCGKKTEDPCSRPSDTLYIMTVARRIGPAAARSVHALDENSPNFQPTIS